jgi:hypothetical protein
MQETKARRDVTVIERKLRRDGFHRAEQSEFASLTRTYLAAKPIRLRETVADKLADNTQRLGFLGHSHDGAWFRGIEFEIGKSKGKEVVMLFPYLNTEWTALLRPIEVYKKTTVSQEDLNLVVNRVSRALRRDHHVRDILRTQRRSAQVFRSTF